MLREQADYKISTPERTSLTLSGVTRADRLQNIHTGKDIPDSIRCYESRQITKYPHRRGHPRFYQVLQEQTDYKISTPERTSPILSGVMRADRLQNIHTGEDIPDSIRCYKSRQITKYPHRRGHPRFYQVLQEQTDYKISTPERTSPILSGVTRADRLQNIHTGEDIPDSIRCYESRQITKYPHRKGHPRFYQVLREQTDYKISTPERTSPILSGVTRADRLQNIHTGEDIPDSIRCYKSRQITKYPHRRGHP